MAAEGRHLGPRESIVIRLEGLEGGRPRGLHYDDVRVAKAAHCKALLVEFCYGRKARAQAHAEPARAKGSGGAMLQAAHEARPDDSIQGGQWQVKDASGDADLMIGGGTLVDASHMAHRLDPANQHVAWVYKSDINDAR
eukprot:4608607-Pyramimonas_sp.AAC.1